jgi:hypothetical protein
MNLKGDKNLTLFEKVSRKKYQIDIFLVGMATS